MPCPGELVRGAWVPAAPGSCHDASRPHSADSDLGRAAPTSALIAPRPSEFLEQPGLLPEGSNATCFIVGSARAAAGGRLEF